MQKGFPLVCLFSIFFSILPLLLVSIFPYMSLPYTSPSFNFPLFLSLICLQCLPNFVILHFLALEFHSRNVSPDFSSWNCPPLFCLPNLLFLFFSTWHFTFENFSPRHFTPENPLQHFITRNLLLNDDEFTFNPHTLTIRGSIPLE